ncbi:MAG: hypothetical protein K2P73_09375 [Lachnospiraceae bacterium]|nr:hypothetical protein [Lachnospiraceae bacterium]
MVMIAVKCVKRTSGNIKVYGHITDYTYYDRRLSVSDFEQFDHNSTYRDIVDRIGLENGTIGSGILRSYYELEDGRFVICGVWGNGLYFSVVNHEDHEYYLLPPTLKQKSDIMKKREIETARQSEMNSILWMLGVKDWKTPEENGQGDIPLGEYSAEMLERYTDGGITAKTSYYFGRYRESGMLPLIQIIQLYEEQEVIYFGYVLWDTNTHWDIFIDNYMEYIEGGGDCVDRCEKYELKGQKEVLDINGEDSDLTSISLLPDKIANSLTDFLVKQKVIKNKRNSCVEFWGEDGSGKYVCLISANPWEIGWEIDADSRGTKYYFVTLDTLDGTVVSVNVVQLNRRL